MTRTRGGQKEQLPWAHWLTVGMGAPFFCYKADRNNDSSLTTPVSPVLGVVRRELGSCVSCVLSPIFLPVQHVCIQKPAAVITVTQELCTGMRGESPVPSREKKCPEESLEEGCALFPSSSSLLSV